MGEHNGLRYIAMEYVPGQTVRSVVAAHGPLTVDAAARVFRGAAFGLAAVHDKGFIHRDVKPSNIMITPDGPAKLVPEPIRVAGIDMRNRESLRRLAYLAESRDD